ncbi:MAG: 3-deoxy-D-manno-octulosonic acid transferase [Desulfarculaceae bacterium]|nr:3-deoxy-D-manno-octulosonic acid transferase [Desulfarculaceae bacterium]
MKTFLFIYNAVINTIFLVGIPVILPLAVLSPKRRPTFFRRLGCKTGIPEKEPGKRRLWIHALSVGEVRSACPLLKSFSDTEDDLEIIFTATTKTGEATAKELFSGPMFSQVKRVAFFPFDFNFAVSRVCSLVGPDAVVIVETDLWPNFLVNLSKRKIPVFLVNARLSKNSFKGYARLSFLFSYVLSCFSKIGVQTADDLDKFQRLGVAPSRLTITGNMKFDQQICEELPREVTVFNDLLKTDDQTRILVAGSTHEGEEEIVIESFFKLRKRFPGLVLIIAPRNPKRGVKISRMLQKTNTEHLLTSRLFLEKPACKIFIVDRMGLLSPLYSICDAAFVGGSMVKQGGHNPLEAAAWAKPVLFGPHMDDFAEAAELLIQNGAAWQVKDGSHFTEKVEFLLANESLKQKMGTSGRKVFLENQGAVYRTVDILEEAKVV